MVAVRLGVRPFWPWPPQLLYAVDLFKDLVLDPHAFQVSLILGKGFSFVHHPDLQQTLSLACRAIVGIDLYHRNAPTAPKIWEICPVRNAVMHRLCSLDPPPNSNSSRSDATYNIVRLSALIFGDFVLFPIPDSTSVKPRLVYDLRKALEAFFQGSPASRQERDLVTWCTAMGAMASHSTVHKEWYTGHLNSILRDDPRLLDWILFQTLMGHFLWWDFVLYPRCWDIWSEAVQLLASEQSHYSSPSKSPSAPPGQPTVSIPESVVRGNGIGNNS